MCADKKTLEIIFVVLRFYMRSLFTVFLTRFSGFTDPKVAARVAAVEVQNASLKKGTILFLYVLCLKNHFDWVMFLLRCP